MRCTLLIPHLAGPADAARESGSDLNLPHLATLMSRARHRLFAAVGWEAWLLQAFEVARQHDWPIAPFTLTIDGGDPGEAYWLRADPVHIRLHRNRLVLADAHAFAVTAREARAIVESLNAHFGPERLHFSAPRPDRWYLRLSRDPEICTTPLDEAAGAAMDLHLPTGPNALTWHRILNEAQMLLHTHAVNEQRDARGEPVVNGIWLWGGGSHTAVRGRHFTAVVANDPLALALAAHADIPARRSPLHAVEWLASDAAEDEDAHALIVLDALTEPARRGDLDAWRSALRALDSDWIAALVGALRAGAIAEIALVAPAANGCHRFELKRSGLLRFWRAPQALAHWL